MTLTDMAMYLYGEVCPLIRVGPYKFRRKYTDILFQGLTEYDFCGITKNTVVLDLGASVGGFSVPAAKKCKWVYAVEPLFYDILEENFEMNDITNYTIYKYAIGEDWDFKRISFKDRSKFVKTIPFKEILAEIPEQVSFMKCDIEGAERYVDFTAIPNIEAEIHDYVLGCMHYHKRNGRLLDVL